MNNREKLPGNCMIKQYLPADYYDILIFETRKELRADDILYNLFTNPPLWITSLFCLYQTLSQTNRIGSDKKNFILNSFNMYRFKTATYNDIPVIKTLFQDTVKTINRQHYTKAETEDWASCGDNLSHWQELIDTLYFIIAETKERQAVGFASISNTGYLHSMFIHKEFQRQGVATALYREIETYAKTHGINRLTSEVSITARPFFEKQGFSVDREQKMKANKLFLTNYKMSKSIK